MFGLGQLLSAQTTALHCDFSEECAGIISENVNSGPCQTTIVTGPDVRGVFLNASSKTPCKEGVIFRILPGADDKITILDFSHEYDLPEGIFGVVEVSYDGGNSFSDITSDRFGNTVAGFYSKDEKGFSGITDKPSSSQFQWVWGLKKPTEIQLRFSIRQTETQSEFGSWKLSEIWVDGMQY